jgi:glycoside/pentoside/hexuronide:cation symporter, GPH family
MNQYATSPADRIPVHQKLVYGLGAFVNNLLAAASGGMMIVLNLGLGMNPALVGLLGALPRLTDAFTDPVMGYISDNTRTRWGRRRPYIFIGAIAVGNHLRAALAPAGRPQRVVLLLVLPRSARSLLPCVHRVRDAVGGVGLRTHARLSRAHAADGRAELHGPARLRRRAVVPAVHAERGSSTTWSMAPRASAIIVAVVVAAMGVLPALFLRERFRDVAVAETREQRLAVAGSAVVNNLAGFFRGCALTLRSRPFLKLCAATFLVFNGFMMVSSFQSYVIIYYVFGGDIARGAEYAGWAGTVQSVATFCVIALATWLGTRIGKKRTFYVATGVSMLGYALKWVCYSPEIPWLVVVPAPLLAFGLGGLFTIMPSMIADVVDLDELQTHERREGMYGSIFWWVVKLGMAVALAAGGLLLNATGFDVALAGNQPSTRSRS